MGVFLIDNPETGIIIFSNEAGKKMVQKITSTHIIDGKTSIHDFHKTPERSKGILKQLEPGQKHENMTISIGGMIIKSSSNVIKIDGATYYIGLFEDGTPERKEIDRLFIIQDQIFSLFQHIANDSDL